MRRRFTAACFMAALSLASAAVTLAVARPSDRPIAISAAPPSAMFAADPGLPLLPAPTQGALQAKRDTGPTGPRLTIPILVYHYIRVVSDATDHLGWGLSVPPKIFKAQMDWLRSVGAHTVTLGQIMDALHGGSRLPPRSVALTFDDGHSDFATAAVPILVSDGFVATDFVNTAFLGRPSYMTPSQVQQVSALGMVIGDHTVNHLDLNALPPSAVKNEINADRATLQALIGKPVTDFAYPYGDFNATVVSIVAAQGFRDAVTMARGATEWLAQPFVMPRVRIGGGDTAWTFAAKAGIPLPPSNWVDPAG